jgi:hypothetical protein
LLGVLSLFRLHARAFVVFSRDYLGFASFSLLLLLPSPPPRDGLRGVTQTMLCMYDKSRRNLFAPRYDLCSTLLSSVICIRPPLGWHVRFVDRYHIVNNDDMISSTVI